MLNSRKIVPGNSRLGESGMSIIELLVAMTVLTVGMLGSMIMILVGMQSNTRNKNDTSAVVLDQEILGEVCDPEELSEDRYSQHL